MNNLNSLKGDQEFVYKTWAKQKDESLLHIEKAYGCYFEDSEGKKYLDFAAQLSSVNAGHDHPKITASIINQTLNLNGVNPSFSHKNKNLLGEKISKILPGDLNKTFFTLAGTDAIENSLKIARMYTGKKKVISRYRSYHGSSFGAMAVSGDPRRHFFSPDDSWVIRVPDPYPYRSPIYSDRSKEEGDEVLLQMMEDIILLEDPQQIGAILLEGYCGGTGGIAPSSAKYWQGIRYLCDKYNILLIVDEILSGFGRTGKWFAFEHYDVIPDIVVMSKGLTSGYIPLGAVTTSDKIYEYFNENTLGCGLTYSGYPLGCAAALASISVYEEENLVEKAAENGVYLEKKLHECLDGNPWLGEIRGKGLLQVIELVSNTDTKKPLSPWNAELSNEMKVLKQKLLSHGLFVFLRWNMLFITPPLSVSKKQIDHGVNIIKTAIHETQAYFISEGG